MITILFNVPFDEMLNFPSTDSLGFTLFCHICTKLEVDPTRSKSFEKSLSDESKLSGDSCFAGGVPWMDLNYKNTDYPFRHLKHLAITISW